MDDMYETVVKESNGGVISGLKRHIEAKFTFSHYILANYMITITDCHKM
jgi:hypothetical protein